jgi:hypothetical protein
MRRRTCFKIHLVPGAIVVLLLKQSSVLQRMEHASGIAEVEERALGAVGEDSRLAMLNPLKERSGRNKGLFSVEPMRSWPPMPAERRAVTHSEPVGGGIKQRDSRHLNADAVAIVPDRARQSRLGDADQASGNDHCGCRNSSLTHGVVPQPRLDLGAR